MNEGVIVGLGGDDWNEWCKIHKPNQKNSVSPFAFKLSMAKYNAMNGIVDPKIKLLGIDEGLMNDAMVSQAYDWAWEAIQEGLRHGGSAGTDEEIEGVLSYEPLDPQDFLHRSRPEW